MKLFKVVSIISALLLIYLFSSLMFDPESFIQGAGLKECTAASVIARRASIFMLGIAALLLRSVKLKDLAAMRNISLLGGLTFTGLACMGTYEFAKQTVNSGIFMSIAIESVLGVLFWIAFAICRVKTEQTQ